MGDQKVTLLVMLDLSAAFGIIDHSILLETFGFGCGVGGTALKWFTTYLSQRTQQIQIKGILSKINFLENHVPKTQGYADDHQVYLPFRPIPFMNQTASVTAIAKCVVELTSWMISNMLMMNDNKT